MINRQCNSQLGGKQIHPFLDGVARAYLYFRTTHINIILRSCDNTPAPFFQLHPHGWSGQESFCPTSYWSKQGFCNLEVGWNFMHPSCQWSPPLTSVHNTLPLLCPRLGLTGCKVVKWSVLHPWMPSSGTPLLLTNRRSYLHVYNWTLNLRVCT